jgi:hypothetical protein
MQNKDSGYNMMPPDEIVALLKYDSLAETFNYNFMANGLTVGDEYDLIYYADGSYSGLFIDSNIADTNGNLTIVGSKDLGMDLPNSSDTNHPYGAKIWLVRADQYIEGTNLIGDWSSRDEWFFDNWPGLIRYTKSTNGNPFQSETVYFSDLAASPQLGTDHDYSTANVSFTYDTPSLSKLSGIITGTGLKPNMTYQTKFIGKPTCAYGISGNDSASEYIGYKGRWTCLDCVCSGAGCNRTDAAYEANKALPDGHGDKECIAGYLAWDYITADNSGAITKTIETTNSYHVLWCSGGTCGQTNNSQLVVQSPYPICAESDVNGQIERFTCDGLVLDAGTYNLDFVLTEESFHQDAYGVWTTVMGTDINFEIE